ncbi:MAG: cytochrome c [Bacteroidetes bacterium]|nr:cytochrome c [Bacteroidota bacterium]
MYKGILHSHYLVVTLFLLLYVIKTILLISDKIELFEKFSKKMRIPEMIISALFLITGIYLTTQLSFGGKYDFLFWIKIILVFASIPIAVIGFKKKNKMLAALSLLMITGSFGLAEVYHKRKGIAAESSLATNDAASIYKSNCALCHGDNGKLGASGAKDLSLTTLSNEDIKNIILQGKGAMPAAQVNAEQAQAVAEYVLSNIKGK